MQEDLFPIPLFVVRVLEQAGVDLEEVLRRCDSPSAGQAGSKRIRLPTDRYFAFWRAVEASGIPPDFGLRLTEAPVLYQMDVASSAALLSENFGEALSTLARYKRLTCPEEIDVEVVGEEAQVGLRWLHGSGLAPPMLVDATLAWMCRIASLGSESAIRPIRIELTRAESPSKSLSRYFGCGIKFNSARDVLVFPKGALETPFASHHPEMLALMTPGLEAALRARAAAESLAQQVRNLLVKGMGGQAAERGSRRQGTARRRPDTSATPGGRGHELPEAAGRGEATHRAALAVRHGPRHGGNCFRARLRGTELLHPSLSKLGRHQPRPLAHAERRPQID